MTFGLVLLLTEPMWLWFGNYPLEPDGLSSGDKTEDNGAFFQESVKSQ